MCLLLHGSSPRQKIRHLDGELPVLDPRDAAGVALMLPIWAIGVAGIGAVLLLGLARLAWLSAGATPMADPRWLAEAARTAARLG
jgi:hypothetical protein